MASTAQECVRRVVPQVFRGDHLESARRTAEAAAAPPWMVWLAACALVLLPAACDRPAPEEALRATIAELRANIQSRDAAALRGHLAEDFIGPGGMDRDQARRTAALYMLRHESVLLTLGPLEIDLQEAHATVGFTAALTAGSGFLVPERGSVYKVETGWRLEGRDWKLTSAKWTTVL